MKMKIKIKYTMTAPVSHIGETASIGSYFQTIKTKEGRLPIITANSVRGTLRDCGAKVFLETLGVKVSKEIFHMLFSGGNLDGTMKNDIEKAKNVRENIPFLSLFGGGLGDMILSGKMSVGNLYPICKETYEMLGEDLVEISWKNLIDEIEFTRSDDGKDDNLAKYIVDITEEKKAKASTQMRYSVQYMAQGTVFLQNIHLFDNITDLEKGALFSAFKKWFEMPRLGGMAAKGFGSFDADIEDAMSVKNGKIDISAETSSLIGSYEAFVREKGESVLDHLKKEKKNGKK